MAGLFSKPSIPSPPQPAAAPPPPTTVDTTVQRDEERQRLAMRAGRASTRLSAGAPAPTSATKMLLGT